MAGSGGRRVDPYVSMRAFYGAELRHWRQLRSLSQDELGARTGDSGDLIRKVELAERWPPEGFSERADRALETGGALVRLEPWVRRERRAGEPERPSNPDAWTVRFAHGPISHMHLMATPTSQSELLDELRGARQRINVLGLTRNFYARDHVRAILEEKARSVPVRLYLMDPRSVARRERYRVEPIEAALEDPQRMERELLLPLRELAERVAGEPGAGLQVYLYNFPISFSVDEIDTTLRVAPYGLGVRGTEGPIFVFKAGTPYYDWFSGQLRWLESLAEGEVPEPWRSKGLAVRPLTAPPAPAR